MSEGYISLHRKIRDHWIWNDPVKFKWWVDLLLTVNHSDKKVNIGFELYDCKRGQTVMSLNNWGERWKVNKDTVRNFFVLLEKDEMITRENLIKTTRITICNYDSYQGGLHVGQTLDKRKATQTIMNNNKKENILLSEIKISDGTDQNIIIAQSFWTLFKSNLQELKIESPTIEKAKVKPWSNSIRLMFEQDKRTTEEFREVYDFLKKEIPKSSFSWKANIRSTSKLREKFDNLLIEARKPKPNGKDEKQNNIYAMQ